MDIAAVGDLDAELTGAIPFYVLYSTILDDQYTATLCKVAPDKVKPVTLEEVSHPKRPAVNGDVWEKSFGPFKLAGEKDGALLRLPSLVEADDQEQLRAAFLEALERCDSLRLDFNALDYDSYLHVLETACRAHVTFYRRGKTMERSGEVPIAVRDRMKRLGAPCKLCRDGEMECFLV